jgi:hypothetical protein
MSSLSLPVVNLMPGMQWAILKEEKVLSLLVEVMCIENERGTIKKNSFALLFYIVIITVAV